MRPKKIELASVTSKVYPVDPYCHGNRVAVGGTFSATYSVDWTNSDVQGGETPLWNTETAQDAQTGASALYYDGGITAFRFRVTAYTSGTVEFHHSDQKGA